MSTVETKEVVRYQDEKGIIEDGARFKQQVEALKITSQDTFNQMLATIKAGKAHYKSAVEYVVGTPQKPGPKTRAQQILDRIREYLRPFEQAESIGKERMRTWEQAEEKKRQEREAAAAKKREEEAAAAKKNGDPEKAKEILAAPLPQRDNRAHVAGTAYVDNWKGRLAGSDETSILASQRELIKAVLAEKAPANFLTLDWSEVNKFARATSGKMPVPGLEFYNDRYMKVGK